MFFKATNLPPSSCAVDRNGTDQSLSGTDYTLLESTRVIWDIDSNYDSDQNAFLPPADGVYMFDVGLKVTDCVNVKRVVVGLFLDDDLWFIAGEHVVDAGLTDVYINNFVSCDMYIGNVFDVRLKLEPVSELLSTSATLVGDDDYTAWGWGLVERF